MMTNDFFTIYFLAGVVAGWGIRFHYGGRVTREDVANERLARVEFPLVVLAFVAMHVLPLVYLFTNRFDFADYTLPLSVQVLGAVLYALSLWLFWRSHADLGRNWSPVPRILHGQSLVTNGVYRRVRHPMYAAHWLGAVSQALLIPNWIAGASFSVIFLFFYLLRVPREEKLMLEFFGEPYREYMARTNRLIPRFADAPDQLS